MVQAKEADQKQKFYNRTWDTPSLSLSEMTNPLEAVYISCEAFREVHIIDPEGGRLYRIVPQECLQGGAIRISYSFIEKGDFAAGQVQPVYPYHVYEIKGTQIKFNVKTLVQDYFDFLVEAPEGWEVLEESQPLSTEKFYKKLLI